MNRAVEAFSWLVRRPFIAVGLVALIVLGRLFLFHPFGPPPPRGPHGPHGHAVITALDPRALTLQNEEGWTKSIVLDDKTIYRNGREPASYNDLRVGLRIHVHDARQDDGTWVAREIQLAPPPPPHHALLWLLPLGLIGGAVAFRCRKKTPGQDPLPTSQA